MKLIGSVKKEHIIRLAAMECGASCLMTALRMLGENTNHFLLDYWNINYEPPTLMGNRELSSPYYEWIFGLELNIQKSDLQTVGEIVSDEALVLLLCNPVQLKYFPRKLITGGHSGDYHYVLIYDYDPQRCLFRIIDPIAHYIGELTFQELSVGVEKVDQVEFILLKKLSHRRSPPNNQELFTFAKKRNFENVHSDNALVAIEKFKEDLTNIIHWEVNARDNWIYHNNVSLSTIVKLRAMVWKSLVELGVMTVDQVEVGQQTLQSIVKLWTAFSFQLTKFKRNLEESFSLDMLKQFVEIQSAEVEFLAWMYRIEC